MLNPAQVETCSEPLLRSCKAAARDLNVPVPRASPGGNLLEFQRIMEEYCKTPVQFLADIGFLDTRTLLGHGVFTTAHPWSHYPFGDDLRVLAETGATVSHCPYKYAKMAIALHSFQRYLNARVHVALGTDTFPMDMVAELRLGVDALRKLPISKTTRSASRAMSTTPPPWVPALTWDATTWDAWPRARKPIYCSSTSITSAPPSMPTLLRPWWILVVGVMWIP